MTGRNAPCPCGSGKKYKKCCLLKDRAREAQKTAVNEHPNSPKETISPFELGIDDDWIRVPADEEVNPLLQRINDFWDDFMDAPYEDQWAATNKMLAEEPELCDDEMVFEIANDLFGQAIAAGEIDRYKALLNRFEEIVPESYAEELHYILDWRTQIALIEGNDDDVARCFYQFSLLAGDHLDVYYRIISALAYHGKLAILHEGMRQARPFVAEGGSLVEWAYDEYVEKLGDIEILHLLNQNPNLNADDQTLQQHLAEYELMIDPDLLALILDYRTGRKTPSWEPDDFKFSGHKKDDPAKRNFALLLAAFTYFTHVEGGIPRTKVEMARDEISNYISQRHAGELDEEDFDYEFGRRPKRKRRKKTNYALCPDTKTLDRYMAKLMGFMSFRYHETYALFELLPVWLCFLTKYELLDEESRVQIIKEMDYLKDPLIEIATHKVTDPTLKPNVVNWPYDFGQKQAYMKDKQELDEMRQQIQDSLSKSKRDELRDKFGMQAEYTNPNLPPEAEISFLDDVLEFERQFENVKTITVRERIGNPELKSLDEMPLYALEQAVTDLLNLLAENGVGVDFLGDFDDIAAYRYLTEELLDEEIDDFRGGWMSVFTPSTPEYDVQMWVEDFVLDLFTQEREYFPSSFDKQPLFDMMGEPITAVHFRNQIEAVWKYLPATNKFLVEPIAVQIEEVKGSVTAVITWRNDKNETNGQIESYFRLQISPYTGWDIVQTSLLDDLLQFFKA